MATFRGDHRVGFFVRWELDPVQRLWLAFGDIRGAPNTLDAAEETYSGLGEVLNIPPLAGLVNGTADRVTLQMSGVSPKMMALASLEAETVKVRRMTIGICEFDENWQMKATGIRWIWTGWSDFVSLKYASDRSGKIVRVIACQVSTLFTRRRRATFFYWTFEETKRRSPTDLFWERTKLYARGTQKVWPRFQRG